MSKTIEVKGKKFSEETIVAALEAHCDWPEEYIFKPGDVAKSGIIQTLRIIVRVDGKIYSIGETGTVCSCSQKDFENNHYVKVGTIKDLRTKL